jgi:hypothetical protein
MSKSEKKELELNFMMFRTLPTEMEQKVAAGEEPTQYPSEYEDAKVFDGMTGKQIIARCKELIERSDNEKLQELRESKGEQTP